MNDLELQRTVTRIALEASGPSGFALAGSGAIREHGINLKEYGVDAAEFDAIKDRLTCWAAQLQPPAV